MDFWIFFNDFPVTQVQIACQTVQSEHQSEFHYNFLYLLILFEFCK